MDSVENEIEDHEIESKWEELDNNEQDIIKYTYIINGETIISEKCYLKSIQFPGDNQSELNSYIENNSFMTGFNDTMLPKPLFKLTRNGNIVNFSFPELIMKCENNSISSSLTLPIEFRPYQNLYFSLISNLAGNFDISVLIIMKDD